MSAPPGEYFANADFFSPSRMSMKTVTIINGTQVNSLTPTWPGQIVVVKEAGGGFAENAVLQRNAANTQWLGIAGGIHKHNFNTDTAGGRFDDVIKANMGRLMWIKEESTSSGNFAHLVISGSVSNQPHLGRFVLNTNNADGNKIHSSKSGLGFNYGRSILMQFKGYATHSSFISVKIGVNMEDVNDAHNTDRKFGLEACDSAGIARTYDLVSASGAIRDIVGTTEDVGQTSARGYLFRHIPGQAVDFWLNGFINTTNANNVSASGAGSGRRNVSMGVQTNNATGKSMFVYAVAAVGGPSDPQWFIVGTEQ